MRRKSTRNPRKSPERTNVETQKTSRNKSSRRRKRSSSRSDEDSNDEVTQLEIKKPVRDHTAGNPLSGDEKSDIGSKYIDGESVDSVEGKAYHSKLVQESPEGYTSGQFSSQGSPLYKDVNEDFQEQEEVTEDKELKKNKGKSKGKNYSKIEQSSNNIEPETENENVQGTPQSPSNDNADNENVVQNVNDTARTNTEAVEETGDPRKCENRVIVSEQIIVEQEVCFESEYAQKYVDQNSNKSDTNTTEYQELDKGNAIQVPKRSSLESCDTGTSDMEDKSRRKSSNAEERSTTPEPKFNAEIVLKNKSTKSFDTSGDKVDKSRRKFSAEEKDHGESTSFKKKITLRRSPPENKERGHSSTSDESKRDTEARENKSGKKITLKRPTIDEKSSISEEKVDRSAENVSSRRTSGDFPEKKRRLSSLCEDKGQDMEEKPKKSLRPVKLIRNFSRENNEINEDKQRLAIAQRQKWSRSDWLPKLMSSFYKVDVESIKIVCPSLKFLNESEVKLESTPKERRKSENEHRRKLSLDAKSEDSDRPEYEKQTSEDSSGEIKIELNPNIIAMNRKISIVDDTASKLRPPPSPAKHPTSDVLFITNLVRPFTVKQLKELLERTGKIKEGGFWTDRIKSKCYVHYDSKEEAEATRNALHGVHWPIGNGKKLIIDYATVEDLEKAKNPPPPPIIIPDKVPEKENRVPEKVDIKYKERDREERKRDGVVREWDLGKEEIRKGRSRSRSRSRERVRKHSRRSYTPEIYNNHKKPRKIEEPVPQKLMDDLFLKTKATPSIYWQPLSPEEIMTKQQQRLVRMEEHKRRIEETRGRVRDNRRGPFRRR